MRGEFLDLGGARLYYYAAGTRGGGEPVVFLHGFPTSSHLWSDVVPLMPEGHRLVVVDLLGYGRSDRPDGRPIGIAGHAERIVALLDALGINYATVVGHDLGGGVAQWLAVHRPTRVARLCLVDSVAFDAWPTKEVKVARALSALTRHLPPAWLLSILRGELLRGYANPARGARSVDRYALPFCTPEGRDALLAHMAALDVGETLALAPRLGGIVAPTAVVWGEDDPFLPVALAQRLHRAIPGATLDTLPGTRHFTPEEAPEKLAEIVGDLLKR